VARVLEIQTGAMGLVVRDRRISSSRHFSRFLIISRRVTVAGRWRK
jgi:hypothetical protein